jgi:hypothetical protein
MPQVLNSIRSLAALTLRTEENENVGILGDIDPTFCNVIGDYNNDGFFDYYNNNDTSSASPATFRYETFVETQPRLYPQNNGDEKTPTREIW